jgi:hypothetical protein
VGGIVGRAGGLTSFSTDLQGFTRIKTSFSFFFLSCAFFFILRGLLSSALRFNVQTLAQRRAQSPVSALLLHGTPVMISDGLIGTKNTNQRTLDRSL